jgi:selenocysteine-specific elongation factor
LTKPAHRLVLGTAGHIDHGKTALIRALTGIETDRLPEEKARGITIELGFAPLDLDGGVRLGVVDVPGHEGLVRTMVAGATGIDLLLLVIAADEGVMPQTREHVAICELLGIEHGAVALTKVDLVDDEMAELAAEEVTELLAPTALADAPIVRVSAVTGEGLPALRETLAALAADAPPRTPRGGPARLSVDRSFEMRGFGSVATGTLVGGALAVGDAIELYPSGLTGRVRGLQSHGAPTERAEPGMRCAVNVQGAALSDLSRGRVIAAPGALVPTLTLDAQLAWLEVAPKTDGATSAAILAGTAERRARVAPIGRAAFEPGSLGFARIHVEGDPIAVVPGDRFVIRGFARTEMGGATLGGGVVLDVAPPHRRRSDPGLVRDLEALAQRDPAADVRVRVARSGLAGIAGDRLERETGLAAEVFAAALAAIEGAGDVHRTPDGRLLGSEACEEIEHRLGDALDAYHLAEPLRPGMPAAALRGTLPENVPGDAAELCLARLAERAEAVIAGEVVRRPSHAPRLDAAARQNIETILEVLGAAGLEAPSLRDLAERVGVGQDALRDLLAHLEREGRLVHTRDLWFDAAAVEALRQRVRGHFEGSDSLDTPTYKSLIGTSRRTAVPLMELFDEERLTYRRGEVRLLRRRGKAQSQE